MNSVVLALAASGSDLYAGGFFTTAGGYPANHIAKWNGTCWSPLGSGINEAVDVLAVSGGNLYAGGRFTTAGGKVSAYVARATIDNLDSVRCPAPEVAVEQPAGVGLVDGVSSVDFGRVVFGSRSQRTFTVRNSSLEDFAVLSFTIDGANAAEFGVTASPAMVLPPGGSATFTANFVPAAPGVREAALHIASSDADQNPFDITLTAIAPFTGFVQTALVTTFTNPTPEYPQYFGSSVAALGSDRLLIGAPGYQSYGDNQVGGAAYLFSTAGTLLTTFTNPSSQVSADFGRAVAAVGNDRVIIGAPNYSLGGDWDPWSGAAYLFRTNGTLLTAFTNPAPGFDDHFGQAVAGVGNDRVVIGAPWFGGNYGAAFLFGTDGTLLKTFTNGVGETGMGMSVAALGSGRVLIGAPWTGDLLGAAYLYDTDGTLLKTFTNPSGGYDEAFGHSVVVAGNDRVLVGAPWYSASTGNSGAAYLFDTNGTFLTTFADPTPGTTNALAAR